MEQKKTVKVEILSKSLVDYDTLVENLKKSEKLDDFTILYNFGKYQMIIDGQEILDKAKQHNGRNISMKFVLQKNEKSINQKIKSKRVTKIFDSESLANNCLSIDLSKMDKISNDGTFDGKSYKVSSNTSRYSEKISGEPRRYKLGKKLGEGTLGKVYLAVESKGGTYAAKIIKKNSKRLPLEADVEYLKMLHHKSIVEYMFIIEPAHSNEIHIFMEFMQSGSLDKFIETNAPLHSELVKCYVKQIAEGLDFLHSKNIIHQDLKPANLLLNNSFEKRLIKIADFGSSRFFSASKRMEGHQGRTPKYTAPEVTRGNEVPGRRSDIWSFGVITVEMFTGVYPWKIEGQHPLKVAQILEEEPANIVESEKTDRDLVNLSKMMLAPLKNRPYASDILELDIFDAPPNSQTDSNSDSDSDYY